MTATTLAQWLGAERPALAATLGAIAQACARIAGSVARSSVAPDALGTIAGDCLATALAACPHVAAWGSAAHEDATLSARHADRGDYLVLFEALAGAADIAANVSPGSVFSLLPHPFRGTPPGAAGFLQPGRRQVAAGYVLYGAATLLMLSCGRGVAAFMLDRREGRWQLVRDAVQLPVQTRALAIDASNQRFWEKPVQRYVAECLAGETGPRTRDFKLHGMASLVAEVHRIFSRGGVLLCPRDTREPRQPGPLHLLHVASPLAWLVEQAGGSAVTGTQNLLDLVPDTLGHKVPVILGSRDEVQRIVRYHAEPSENVSQLLFKTRSLFVQPQA